jgi:ubiquinone/menaquinone biosynthesis C-methylase UbiE
MEFKDHFSRQAAMYAKARPTYPDELFQFLASMSPSKELCWDCATGNGQAAVSLAHYFKKVIATDGSEKQILNAVKADNIEYRVALAEASSLPDHSVDLITAATAAHWFNHEKFYAEVKRVAKPGAILAIWTYSEAIINMEIDFLMEWFMYEFLYNYWPDSRWYVRGKYETLPFPFKTLETPAFYCHMNWNRAQWLNYVQSWSAYDNYVVQTKTDPLQELLPKLEKLWPEEEVKKVTWPLHIKCTRLD